MIDPIALPRANENHHIGTVYEEHFCGFVLRVTYQIHKDLYFCDVFPLFEGNALIMAFDIHGKVHFEESLILARKLALMHLDSPARY